MTLKMIHLLLMKLNSYFYCFLQTAWVLIKRSAEYKPLQFLAFAFVYRIFEKLKAFEPAVSPSFTVRQERAPLFFFFFPISHTVNMEHAL